MRCLPVHPCVSAPFHHALSDSLSVCVSNVEGVHTLLPGGLLDLGGHADTDEPVVGLELLHRLVGVVDESEAGALATTVPRPEAEDGNLVLATLVQLRELVTELVLGDVGAVGVEDIAVYPVRSPLAVTLPASAASGALTQPSACGPKEGCG